jgi:hypothetical protein
MHMRNLRRLAFGATLVAIWAGSAMPIMAADNGAVDAQVTVATPCIVVSPGAVDFGTLPFSLDNAPVSMGLTGVSYTNCSASSERIFGRGTNASGNDGGGSVTWTLSQPICPDGGLNIYGLWVRNPVSTSNKGLFLADEEIETVAAGDVGASNQLRLDMPCAGSDGGGAVMSFQAIFTATF